MKRINLNEIIVPQCFLDTIPKEEKMEECRNVWKAFGVQDRYIVINNDKELIDGYIQYLVLKENNVNKGIEVRISDEKKQNLQRKNLSYLFDNGIFVFGFHPQDKTMKEYCWKVPENRVEWANKLKFGDKIFCNNNFNDKAPVIVTRVLDELPNNYNYPVRKVASKIIIRWKRNM